MTQLCVSSYCGIPRQHVEGCDGHLEDCEYPGCEGCCRGCLPARAADGLYLCLRCRRLLPEDAWTAAELYEALGLVLTGGGKQGEKTSGGGGSGTDLNPAAVEARSAIRATVVALVRLVAEERGVALPVDELPAMARFLERHADWLAAHHAAGEHARDLRDIATDYRTRRLAYPSASDRLYIGECPLLAPTTDGSRKVCGTRLYQLPEEPLVTCRGCETRETIKWWHRTITGETGGVVDAYAAAHYLSYRWRTPVDPGLIRKWASRGKVQPLTEPVPNGGPDETRPVRDAKGRAQYQLTEVVECARKLWGPAWDEPRSANSA